MAININVSSSPAKATATQYAKQGHALRSARAKKCSTIISTLSMPTTGETTPPSSRSTSTTKIKAPAKLYDCPSEVSPAEFFAAAIDDASSDANDDRDASSSSVGASSGTESFSCNEETVADDGHAIVGTDTPSNLGVRNKKVVMTKNGQKMGVKKGVTNSTKGPKKGVAKSTKGGKSKGVAKGGTKQGGTKQGGTKGGAPSIDSLVVLPLSNMATLNEQHRIKLQKKVPKGSIGNYNPTQPYAPAIVAKINEINEIDSVPSSASKCKLQRALTNLSKMFWNHGYDLIINNISRMLLQLMKTGRECFSKCLLD
eukprot:scaffold21637_cov155-Skeletonema_dohrnii-CCMP3373.AAC.1